MQQFAKYISLLDEIQYPYPELQAALAGGGRMDDDPDELTGMHNNFEPKKKSNMGKNATADIGFTTGVKTGIDKTRIEIRYHK